MASAQVSAMMTQTSMAMDEARRLIEQMRELRREVREQTEELSASAFTLRTRMAVAMIGSRPITPAPAPARDHESKDVDLLRTLTSRELEVLKLIGEGQRTKEIAYSLGITFKTAVTHRSNIMEKLNIHEGPRLVRFAIRTGVCKP